MMPAQRPAEVLILTMLCMAKASWLQRDKQISNPYYGSKMLRCGELK
jgi:hypothetical protein